MRASSNLSILRLKSSLSANATLEEVTGSEQYFVKSGSDTNPWAIDRVDRITVTSTADQDADGKTYANGEQLVLSVIFKSRVNITKEFSAIYTDENGKSHQRWESFPTNTEARKRKNQIEYEQDSNTFVVPEAKTVRELLVDYLEIYGVNKWAMSTYEAKNRLIHNTNEKTQANLLQKERLL